MSIVSEITRLQNAKSDIKASIENKGVTVGDGTIDTYASKINEISTSSAVLGTKTITENGTYKASDDNLDGYSSVEVATSGVDINDYFDTSQYFPNVYSHYLGVAVKKIPYFDASKNDKFEAYFYHLENLIELPLLDYSKGTSFANFCMGCSKLQTIDISTANGSKVKNSASMFNGCSSLIKLIINNPILFPMTNSNMLQSTPIAKGTGYVYVPDDMVDTYKSATNWSTYASQIKGMSELV